MHAALGSQHATVLDDKRWPQLKQRLLASDDPVDWLEAIRQMQILLGDLRATGAQPEVYNGYSGGAVDRVPKATRDEIVDTLAPKFPAPDNEVNRELGRLFALIEADHAELPARIAAQWTQESTPQDDVHYLIILSRLPARERGMSRSARHMFWLNCTTSWRPGNSIRAETGRCASVRPSTSFAVSIRPCLRRWWPSRPSASPSTACSRP
jgi:hypothetical protein